MCDIYLDTVYIDFFINWLINGMMDRLIMPFRTSFQFFFKRVSVHLSWSFFYVLVIRTRFLPNQ